jgi:hypothetical protein
VLTNAGQTGVKYSDLKELWATTSVKFPVGLPHVKFSLITPLTFTLESSIVQMTFLLFMFILDWKGKFYLHNMLHCYDICLDWIENTEGKKKL